MLLFASYKKLVQLVSLAQWKVLVSEKTAKLISFFFEKIAFLKFGDGEYVKHQPSFFKHWASFFAYQPQYVKYQPSFFAYQPQYAKHQPSFSTYQPLYVAYLQEPATYIYAIVVHYATQFLSIHDSSPPFSAFNEEVEPFK